MIEFNKLVEDVIYENMTSGSSSSVFGSSVTKTAQAMSGDTYNPKDARTATALGTGEIVTRGGLSKKKRRKKK